MEKGGNMATPKKPQKKIPKKRTPAKRIVLDDDKSRVVVRFKERGQFVDIKNSKE